MISGVGSWGGKSKKNDVCLRSLRKRALQAFIIFRGAVGGQSGGWSWGFSRALFVVVLVFFCFYLSVLFGQCRFGIFGIKSIGGVGQVAKVYVIVGRFVFFVLLFFRFGIWCSVRASGSVRDLVNVSQAIKCVFRFGTT